MTYLIMTLILAYIERKAHRKSDLVTIPIALSHKPFLLPQKQ